MKIIIEKKLKEMGYIVRVKYNQICVKGHEPMTVMIAREFIKEKRGK